jgi:GntR family transcriptional regulator
VKPDAALLAITRTASDTDGDPIEYAHDLFRGDRTRLVVRSGDAAASAGGRAQVVELRKALG